MTDTIAGLVVLAVVGYLVYRSVKRRRLGSSSQLQERQIETDIVGESYYQEALASLAGPKCREGYCIPVQIELRREPSNPNDCNAVQCLIDGNLVGYINRDAAPGMQTLLLQAEEQGVSTFADGYIAGGWHRSGKNAGSYGVKLGPPPPSTEQAKCRASQSR